MRNKVVLDHLRHQLVGHRQLQPEHIAAVLADGTHHRIAVVGFLHLGAVHRRLVPPALDLQNAADRTFAHGAGQILRQGGCHRKALVGHGVAVVFGVVQHQLLLFHVRQRVGKLKIVDQLLL